MARLKAGNSLVAVEADVLHDSVSESLVVATGADFLCSASRDSSLISFFIDSLRSLPTRSAYGESVTTIRLEGKHNLDILL